METVYRKTELGQTEIATRQHKLAPRLRSALIVVDGKRSDLELASMISNQPQETLQALLEAGFIEATPEAGSRVLSEDRHEHDREYAFAEPHSASPAYAPTEPLMLTHEDVLEQTAPSARRRLPPMPGTAAMPPTRNIEDTKRQATHWLSDHLGSAAFNVNQRLERCQTSEALGSAILFARSVVEQQLGAETARKFETEMSSVLRRVVTQ